MSKWTFDQCYEAFERAGGRDRFGGYTNAGRRILDLESELAAMRPVVEAAEAWSDSPSTERPVAAHLHTAVDAYRAQREGK